MPLPNKRIIELDAATDADLKKETFQPVFIPTSPGATTGVTKRKKTNDLILQSPNGTYWRIAIDNAGTLTRTAI